MTARAAAVALLYVALLALAWALVAIFEPPADAGPGHAYCLPDTSALRPSAYKGLPICGP